MRARIITPLPIPRLLMLPLPHHFCRLRAEVDQVRYRRQPIDTQRQQYRPSIDFVKDASEGAGDGGDCGALFRQGQGDQNWERGLQAEEDGERSLLERSKLGAWENFVGCGAADEGLPK